MKETNHRHKLILYPLPFILLLLIVLLYSPAYPEQGSTKKLEISEKKEAIMDQSFWTFIAALAAAVAAGATVWYAILTRKTIRANLLSHVLTKYSSRERIEASQKLREYRKRNQELYESFKGIKINESLSFNTTFSISSLDEEIGPARTYLSAFFWELKTYCEAGYLDKKLVAAAVGKAGHELYLDLVEPLDRLNTTFILQRDDYDESVRLYFEESKKYQR